MFFRNKLYKRPSLRISLRYSIIGMIFIILISLILPSLLNYGPESINTQFDIKMSYIPYWAQFASIMVLLLFLLTTITHFLFKSVDKFYLSTDEKKYNEKDIQKIYQKVIKRIDKEFVSKDIDKIKIGDDITYQGTEGVVKGILITHRVIDIEEIDGKRAFHTQGIANNLEDPIVYGDQINGVVQIKMHILTLICGLLNNKYIFYFCGILYLAIH